MMAGGKSQDISQASKRAVLESDALPLPITGLILCGGRSRRMGRPKAFLPFGGSTIIEHMLSLSRELFQEVYLVGSEPEEFAHLSEKAVKDILPGRGPLGGILSGLLVANHPFAFVMSCNMPLLNRRLIRQMASARGGNDLLVLSHQGGIEPLIGIYSKHCIKPLEDLLFSGEPKFEDLLRDLQAQVFNYSEPSGQLPAYFQINTPQDYSELLIKT